MIALVSSGIADIGIADFTVSKDRSEVVALTDTVTFGR
jgi:ABC-type amino acid transport substrate-binding protein